MESPCRGRCPVVQDVHTGGLSSGRQSVRLPLLEGRAARLQELRQSRARQLEGGLEVFYSGESVAPSPKYYTGPLGLSGKISAPFTTHHRTSVWDLQDTMDHNACLSSLFVTVI